MATSRIMSRLSKTLAPGITNLRSSPSLHRFMHDNIGMESAAQGQGQGQGEPLDILDIPNEMDTWDVPVDRLSKPYEPGKDSVFASNSMDETKGLTFNYKPPVQKRKNWRWRDPRAKHYDWNPGFGEGCDYHHWKVYTKPLEGFPPKHDIIRYYVHILSQLLGSEEEAKKKIYSVATKHYYAFGANVPEDLANKIEDLPNVCCIVPDAYVDPIEKRYPWDPFVNGQALPYDKKYYPVGPVESLTTEEKNTYGSSTDLIKYLERVSKVN